MTIFLNAACSALLRRASPASSHLRSVIFCRSNRSRPIDTWRASVQIPPRDIVKLKTLPQSDLQTACSSRPASLNSAPPLTTEIPSKTSTDTSLHNPFTPAANNLRQRLRSPPSLSVRDSVSPAFPGRELSFRPADASTPAHSPQPSPESDCS